MMCNVKFVLLILFPGLLFATSQDSPDVTGIYRYHFKPFETGRNFSDELQASKEVFMRTNVLGRLHVFPNNSYFGPSLGMPHLGCALAASKCSWTGTNWSVIDENMNDVLPQLTVKLKANIPVVDKCSTNNGGCNYKCQQLNFDVACSCPSEFHLKSDQKTCLKTNTILLTKSSGTVTNSNYPEYNRESGDLLYEIIPPKGGQITVEFTTYDNNGNHRTFIYNYMRSSYQHLATMTKYDGRTWKAQDQMRLNINNPYSEQFKFVFTYNTGESEQLLERVMSLTTDQSILRSPPVLPTFPGLCVSVIHKVAGPHDSLSIYSHSNRQHLKLSRSHLFKLEGNWRISRYKASLNEEDMDQALTLEAHFTGMGSKLFSIVGCNPFEDEDRYILMNSVRKDAWMEPVTTKKRLAPKQECYNGGVMNQKNNKCDCPTGFIGPDCNEGCGENRFGNDCGGICSFFESGCLGMIFYKSNLPCLCAPGFTGEFCHNKCDDGYYGASCRMPCGHCNQGTCDIYTGECKNGCQSGYYPPLCQDTYRILTEPPTVQDVGLSMASISFNSSNTSGRGTAVLYQIQYKENESDNWLELQPEKNNYSLIVADITRLKSGLIYQTRVILIDEDGNSYQENQITIANLQTLCTVPSSKEYNLKIENVTESSFTVSWKYDVLSSLWCPVTGFDIVIQEHCREDTYIVSTVSSITYVKILPGKTYRMKIRAITEFGKAPFSLSLPIKTTDDAPKKVINLKVDHRSMHELNISWDKPRSTSGSIRGYRVEYKCIRLLACSEPCHSAGHLEVKSQSVALTGLIPFAQYMVKVAGIAGALGPYTSVLSTTLFAGASVAPDASPVPVIECTNVSIAVQWQAPSNCSGLNGYLQGYRFELVETSLDGHPVLFSGSTQEMRVNFADLIPDTQYEVQVYLVTSGGSNTRHKLVIPVRTSPTTPEKVRDLTVYKRGRRMIGIRWSPPRLVYGVLKSFTVTYRQVGSDVNTEVTQTIDPVQCTAWPNFYCYTINHLVPETQYLIAVKARNTEVDSDGSAATIETTTREGAPSAPTSLQVVNRSQTSLLLEWGPPDMINGILRSFLINVEQTDSLNATDCCAYIPIQELPARGEEQVYRVKVNDLTPASVLTISVTAKTVTLGQSINITTTTPPDMPFSLDPPELVEGKGTVFSVLLKTVEEHPELDSTYLLLVLPPDEAPEPNIWNPELSDLLTTAVNQSFYLVAEYQPEELSVGEVNFGTGMELRNGTLGQLQDPKLSSGTYRIGLALVLDYNGAKSVAYVQSEPFIVQ